MTHINLRFVNEISINYTNLKIHGRSVYRKIDIGDDEARSKKPVLVTTTKQLQAISKSQSHLANFIYIKGDLILWTGV